MNQKFIHQFTDSKRLEEKSSGAKARVDFAALTARLKSCPFKTRFSPQAANCKTLFGIEKSPIDNHICEPLDPAPPELRRFHWLELSEAMCISSGAQRPIRRYGSFCALFEDLVGEVVVNLGFVVEHFEIGVLEQLRVAIAKALANDLLHTRVV